MVLKFVIFILLLFFQCCTQEKFKEELQNELKLPNENFYTVNAFSEIPIVLPLNFYPDTLSKCHRLLDGDSEPSNWIKRYWNSVTQTCITVKKYKLSKLEVDCVENDSNIFKKAIEYIQSQNLVVTKNVRRVKCENLYSFEAGWMTFMSPYSKDSGHSSFIYLKDLDKKFSYSISFNPEFNKSSMKFDSIEYMIISNLDLITNVFNLKK